jgi:hypothetical protein
MITYKSNHEWLSVPTPTTILTSKDMYTDNIMYNTINFDPFLFSSAAICVLELSWANQM